MAKPWDDARILRTVVDLVPAMVGYWDRDLRNRAANAAYLEWFGVTPEQMLGRHIREVIGEALWEKNLPYIEGALAGTPQHFDREIVDASGTTRHSQASYIPDISDDGTVRGFSVLVADVTERVRAERALAEQQQRVAQLSDMLLVVGDLSASLQDLDPDGLQDAVAEAVLALGFDGAIIVLPDTHGGLSPRHGRGIFSVLDGASVARTSTVTNEVVRQDAQRQILDYAEYEHGVEEVRRTGVRTVAAVPIRSGGEVIGVLQAGRTTVRPVTVDESRVLGLLAAVAGTNLRHARSFVDLRNAREELAEQVLLDPLTGVGNRRAADLLLAAARPGDALVVIDLDHFKRVNDEFGHAEGDRVLKALGALLTQELRQRDQAVRLGGEEFLLYLPATAAEDSHALVARIRREWARRGQRTTFSAGIAVIDRGETPEAAQARADAALYEAKSRGRDQIRAALPRPRASQDGRQRQQT